MSHVAQMVKGSTGERRDLGSIPGPGILLFYFPNILCRIPCASPSQDHHASSDPTLGSSQIQIQRPTIHPHGGPSETGFFESCVGQLSHQQIGLGKFSNKPPVCYFIPGPF